MNKLRVGIAGYGVVGKRRRHYIDLHPQMTTVGVCDKDFESSGKFEDGVVYSHDYTDLISQDLDVLFVCMPNDMAPKVTIEGLKNNLHVFCEKPPGRNVADIENVIEWAKQFPGLKLKYGFNHRYHDSVRDALELIQSGELGSIVNIRGVYGKSKFISFEADSDWRTKRSVAGGGILLDQGIHMVDLMRIFAGEFEKVYSFVENSHWGHDVEDNAYALMRSRNGVVAMLHSSATQWKHRFQLDITLDKGALILSGILSGSKSYGNETLTVFHAKDDDQGDPDEAATQYENDQSWEHEIAEFASAILDDQEITNGSAHDALMTMKLVYQIYQADERWSSQWNI
ncbi:MAG: Gfo/Idh/MocA family oxidoreductase [Rhodospirillales bacterium]|nr:Gfo/Idh/MocA family oxidoreductase [Rhodospirillales bacterium]